MLPFSMDLPIYIFTSGVESTCPPVINDTEYHEL